MNTAEIVNEFAGYIAFAALVPLLVATAVYGLGSPWYRSWLGRTIFAQWVSLLAVFAYILTRRFWGEYPGFEWWAVGLYSFLFLAFTAMAAIVVIERRAPARALATARKDNTTMTDTIGQTPQPVPATVNTATVPEIWFKAKRAARTIVQALIILVPTVNLIGAAIIGYLNDQTSVTVPAWVFIVLNGVVVATALLMGLVARIMAVPGVNAWLVKIGLGSVPKSTIESSSI